MPQRALRHRGRRVERTRGDYPQARRERALAERWERENTRDESRLSQILSGLDDNGPLSVEGARGHVERPARLTQRDATMCAEVVQWLGTNVGFCFLEEALRDAGYVIESTESMESWRADAVRLRAENAALRETLARADLTQGFASRNIIVDPERLVELRTALGERLSIDTAGRFIPWDPRTVNPLANVRIPREFDPLSVQSFDPPAQALAPGDADDDDPFGDSVPREEPAGPEQPDDALPY